jgi:predicted regulator of Ras-like GTPase activity (Roadblock/LC7/MglB family)
VILRAVGEEAVLTVLARSTARLGLLLLDMKRAAEDLAEIV